MSTFILFDIPVVLRGYYGDSGKDSLHGLLYATNAVSLEILLGNDKRAHGSIYHQDSFYELENDTCQSR